MVTPVGMGTIRATYHLLEMHNTVKDIIHFPSLLEINTFFIWLHLYFRTVFISSCKLIQKVQFITIKKRQNDKHIVTHDNCGRILLLTYVVRFLKSRRRLNDVGKVVFLRREIRFKRLLNI